MLKKTIALFMALSLIFAISAPFIDHADAKRYRSPSRSFTPDAPRNDVNRQTPQRSDQVNDGTNKTQPGVTNPGAATRSPFGGMGGGLMRGLFLGGLAGLLFGGLLSGFGAFGSLLGLAVNLIALYILFVLVRKVIRYFTDRNRRQGPYRQ